MNARLRLTRCLELFCLVNHPSVLAEDASRDGLEQQVNGGESLSESSSGQISGRVGCSARELVLTHHRMAESEVREDVLILKNDARRGGDPAKDTADRQGELAFNNTWILRFSPAFQHRRRLTAPMQAVSATVAYPLLVAPHQRACPSLSLIHI